jgi:hypothetical protein
MTPKEIQNELNRLQAELDKLKSNLSEIPNSCDHLLVAVHEAVTTESNPYAVDWSNAPEEADCHAFDKSGKGFWFYGVSFNDSFWYAAVFNSSGFTLPTGLDWKQSKTTRP